LSIVADQFDPVFDHLIVEHVASGDAVGSYQLQTRCNAHAE